MTEQVQPLAGIKVVEFTHMVMGPAVGLILGDLGADVIKIEPMGATIPAASRAAAAATSPCITATSPACV